MKVTFTSFLQRILGILLISYISWVLANIMTESFCCFWKCNKNSWSVELSAQNVGQIIIFLYTHRHQELIEVGEQSSSAAISWWRWWFVTFASDSHKVMIALIAVLGNKIVITVLKWSGSHNEGANLESFISEVPTLGSIWHIDLVQLLG